MQTTAKVKRELPPIINLTAAAALRLEEIYKKDNQSKLLRVSVRKTGCSGLSYDMQWVDEPVKGDEVVKHQDITLLVDPRASLFLIGTQMDWEQSAMSSNFTFKNPNEKGRCGCGESFRV